MRKAKRHKPLHSEVQQRRSRHQREAARVRSSDGSWNLQHSPWTIEGELEGFQRFGTGMRTGNVRLGWPRTIVVGLILTMLCGLPLIGGIAVLARLVFGR